MNNGGMTARTETFRTLASPSRVELLHLLQERGRRTLAELVEATGLHPNTVREHLQRLARGGYVTSVTETRTTRGRPRTLYSAATSADVESNGDVARKVAAAAERGDRLRRYLESSTPAAVALPVAPPAAPPGTPTGHACACDGAQGCATPASSATLPARALHQIDALDDHLDQSGFNACIDERSLQVDITDCPYQEMVAESHGMVCVVHLGLVRTVLSQAGGPVTARELLPFAAPGSCTLSLECDDTSPCGD